MSKILNRHRQRLGAVPAPSEFIRRVDDDEGRPALTTQQRRDAGLLDARVALPLQATVVDQRTGRRIPYNPNEICPSLHHNMLWYFGEAPRDTNGNLLWLLSVGPRQCGKSLASSLCVDNVCAQLEGQTGLIIADTDDRAKTLFNYISLIQNTLPIGTNGAHYWDWSGSRCMPN